MDYGQQGGPTGHTQVQQWPKCTCKTRENYPEFFWALRAVEKNWGKPQVPQCGAWTNHGTWALDPSPLVSRGVRGGAAEGPKCTAYPPQCHSGTSGFCNVFTIVGSPFFFFYKKKKNVFLKPVFLNKKKTNNGSVF